MSSSQTHFSELPTPTQRTMAWCPLPLNSCCTRSHSDAPFVFGALCGVGFILAAFAKPLNSQLLQPSPRCRRAQLSTGPRGSGTCPRTQGPTEGPLSSPGEPEEQTHRLYSSSPPRSWPAAKGRGIPGGLFQPSLVAGAQDVPWPLLCSHPPAGHAPCGKPRAR